ncbi:MAG: DUF5684 domain-containing protein [Tenericutes bacterium]|nr:DUF5684 domain-containing protein [Mycoplasmatota bacterium]
MYGDYSVYGDSISMDSSSLLGGALLASFGTMMLISSAVGLVMLISMWKVFKKAGKPGWASIIPIYNIYTMIQIAKLPTYYLLLFMIPIANIYAMFKIYIELAHKFNKSTGFGVGLIFLSVIFFPMLAFGDATYEDSIIETNNNVPNNNTNNVVNNNLNNVNNTVVEQKPVQNTFIQNDTPVMQQQQTITTSSLEIPEAEEMKPEIQSEPVTTVTENKFVSNQINIPNSEPVNDINNNQQ